MSTTAPASVSICPHCKVELLPWARFCMNCGNRLTGFSAQLSPRLVHVGTIGSAGPGKVVLSMMNHEVQPLQIDDIVLSTPGWLRLPDLPIIVQRLEELELELDTSQVPPGGVLRLEITINATGLENYCQTVRLFISESPVFETQSEVAKVFIDPPKVSAKPQYFILKVVSGVAEVLQVRSDDPWVKFERLDLPQLLVPPSFAVSESSLLRAQFTLNHQALLSYIAGNYPSELEAHPYVRLSAGTRDYASTLKLPVEYSTQILVKRAERVSHDPDTWRLKPPSSRTGADLKAGFEVAYDALAVTSSRPPRLTTIDVEIENVGITDWIAEEVGLPDVPAGVAIVGQPTTLPSRSKESGAAARLIRLEIDGNVFALRSHSVDKIRIEVTGSASERKTSTVIEIPVELRRLEPFDGLVAIDFGTTNSTCAKAGRKATVPEMLAIGRTAEGRRRNSVPTAILYQSLGSDGQPVFIIGDDALSAHGTPDALIREVKRLLGSRHRVAVRFVSGEKAEYLPEEIASHFLRAFKNLIELDLGCTVDRCLITHPVVFLEPQIAALRRAFEMAGFEPLGFEQDGGSTSILFEPMGAALDFMFGKAGEMMSDTHEIGSVKEYDVGIFDFGGGTTDFTKMDVVFRREPSRVSMETRIEAMGGATFGGHNVTVTVARFLLKQWKDDRRRMGLSDDMPFELEDIRNIGDPEKSVLFFQNRNDLMRMADEAKIFLSGSGSSTEAYSKKWAAYGWKDEVDHTLELEESVFRTLIEKDITDLVDSFEEMIKTTKKLPDVIVASGNSSRLKLVPELLFKRFGPNAQFVPKIHEQRWSAGEGAENELNNLKDGVVMGIGAQYIMTTAPVSEVFMDSGRLPGMPPVLARRVGINGFSNKMVIFHEVFKKNDTVPKEWTHVVAANLTRNAEIMVLTTGSNKAHLPLVEDRQWNSHVKHVGSLNCARFPPCCSNDKLRKMRLELSVDKDRTIRVRVQDPEDKNHHHDAALLPDEIFD